MKIIEPVSIWNNGLSKEATILMANAANVTLNKSATFWWALYNQSEETNLLTSLTSGFLEMEGEEYEAWENDSVAWDFVAGKLNLTITGDYVAPVIEEESVEETPTEEPATEESPTEESPTEEPAEEPAAEETPTEEPPAEEETITE